MIHAFLLILAAAYFWVMASGQVGITDCALPCIADVNGTSCAPTQWPCLCPTSIYIERLNECVYQACTDAESQQATFGAIANICNVFGFPPTASAEVNAASTMDLTGSVSIFGVPNPSAVPPAPGTVTSGLTILTGMNTRNTINATSTSSIDLTATGSTQSSILTSMTPDVPGRTQQPSSSGPSPTMGTPSDSASLFSFSKYAVCAGGIGAVLGARFL